MAEDDSSPVRCSVCTFAPALARWLQKPSRQYLPAGSAAMVADEPALLAAVMTCAAIVVDCIAHQLPRLVEVRSIPSI